MVILSLAIDSLIQAFVEVRFFGLVLIDFKEASIDSVEPSFHTAIVTYPILIHHFHKDFGHSLWKVVDVLALFDLNMEKCALKNIFRSYTCYRHCTVPIVEYP